MKYLVWHNLGKKNSNDLIQRNCNEECLFETAYPVRPSIVERASI
jgi:hypothetical protein